MPLQLSQTSSSTEVWTGSPNPSDAGRAEQEADDIPRHLHVHLELFVLGQDRLCVNRPRQFARSARLGDFRGCLTTLDCGSTLIPAHIDFLVATAMVWESFSSRALFAEDRLDYNRRELVGTPFYEVSI